MSLTSRALPKTPAAQPSQRAMLSVFALLLLAPLAVAADFTTITTTDGGDGGLVVLVEPTDTTLAQRLADTNRHLTVALKADAQEVAQMDEALAQAGVHPVADAMHWLNPNALPFQTHTVNVLVLDRAAASRLGEEEIQRVLVPGYGFALVDGQEVRKPRPEGMDTWLGLNVGPSGNRLSRDTVLQPPNSIRWLTGPRSGGHHIVSERVHYLEAAIDSSHYHYQAIFGRQANYSHARDAFSGVHLWNFRYDPKPDLLPWGWMIFSDNQRLFLPTDGAGRVPRRGQPMQPLDFQVRDMRSGEVLAKTLPKAQWGERIRKGEIELGDWGMAFSWYHRIISDGTRIYQADGGHTFRALSADGSEVIWEKSVEGEGYADMIASDGETLAVVISQTDDFPAPSFRNFTNNANIAKAVVGLDPATGEERWRYDGVDGFPLVFLIVDHGVVVAANHLIGTDTARDSATAVRSSHEHVKNNFLVSLDAASGQKHFKKSGADDFTDMRSVGNRSSLNVLADRIIYNESSFAYSYDIHSGELVNEVRWGGINFAGWSAATPNYILNESRFISHDGSIDVDSGISRSEARPFDRPANGALYIAGAFRSSHRARTVNEAMAIAREEHFPEPLADDQRLLVRGEATGVREAAPADWPTFRGDFARRGWRAADGPARLTTAWATSIEGLPKHEAGGLRYDWEQNSYSPGIITQAVADAQRVLLSVPDNHEIVCLSLADGKELWRTRLGGRSAAPPTLAGEVAFVGVNDGTVSAINLADGSIIWTFLAAPYERYHNAHQQVESTHPVRSSPILHNGLLYVSAGRHGRSDNGIHVWALDPSSGQVRRKSVITAQHVNEIMQLVGDKLWLAYSELDPDTLERSSRDREGLPGISPDEIGHNGHMGWIGPYLLWRGYRVHGAGGGLRGAGPAIQTDTEFWRFVANAFAEMPFDDINNHKRVIRTEKDHFADRDGRRDMNTFLAGAGRHAYAVTRAGGHIRIAIANTESESQETFDFPIAEGRELVIPDSIAIAHGHVIVTTTAGRVLAFKAP